MTLRETSDTHHVLAHGCNQAKLKPREWDQLVTLSYAGGEPMSAKATCRGQLTGQQAAVGLRNLRARGLVSYEQDCWTHEGRWQATAEGLALVREIRG